MTLTPPAPTPPVLTVDNLRVSFGGTEVVRGISFAVEAGRCLAIVGESGSGKSVTARTLIGLTGDGSTVTTDRLEFAGRSLTGLRDREWESLRGAQIGFVLQDALVSLDQLRPVGAEIDEALAVHGIGPRAERRRRVLELLDTVGVPEPHTRARQRPDELSGGLRQRALIASALALDPPLIIADEPTTALDATVASQILRVIADARDRGKSVILISHDLAVVAALADDVAVMRRGEIVESGTAAAVLENPQHDYTRSLLRAVPSLESRGSSLSDLRDGVTRSDTTAATSTVATHASSVPALRVRDLAKSFRGPDGASRTGVRGVSFDLAAGQTLGIVGESGSGKTTTARMVLGLLTPDGGSVELAGHRWSGLTRAQRREHRRDISAIYQDALSSFDPRWTVEKILADAVSTGAEPRRERGRRVSELLEQVGLSDEHRHRRPLTLSGGQRQRVAIARALAPRPSVIVCDEPVSALDVSIQARVLDLLRDLQADTGVALLFISHDLGVIGHMSDHILVMNDGAVVERGDARELLTDPSHPYTRELLSAVAHVHRDAVSAA